MDRYMKNTCRDEERGDDQLLCNDGHPEME